MTRPSPILVMDDEPTIRKIYGKILLPGPKNNFLAEGAALFGGPDLGANPDGHAGHCLASKTLFSKRCEVACAHTDGPVDLGTRVP
jgi:hypothetical protein